MPPEPHWLEQRLKDLFPHRSTAASPDAEKIHEPSAITGDIQPYIVAALTGIITDLSHTTEGSRNDTLNKSAYRLGRFVGAGHLDETTARAQLQHAAHVSGLRGGEIDKTIQSGLNAGKDEPFILNNRNDYKTLTQSADDVDLDDDLPVPLDWGDVLDDSLPRVEWLIEDIVERGKLYALFAPSKIGKSLLVQYLAADLAASSTVLYLDFENSGSDLRVRYLDMAHTKESLTLLRYFSYPQLGPLDTPLGGERLIRLAEKWQPELIIIDTTSRVIKGAENDSDTFRALYRYTLQRLKELRIAVLRIDHAGKDLAAGQRGSSAKGDDVDTVWSLLRRTDGNYILRCERQRSGNHPDEIPLIKQAKPLRFVRESLELTEATTDFSSLDVGEYTKEQIRDVLKELDRYSLAMEAGSRPAYSLLHDKGIDAPKALCEKAIQIRKFLWRSGDLDRFLKAQDSPGTVEPVLDQQSLQDTSGTLSVLPNGTVPGHPQDSQDSQLRLDQVGLSRDGRGYVVPLPGAVPTSPLQDGVEQIQRWFGKVHVVECQAHTVECEKTTHLMQVGQATLCRQCAYMDGKRRNARCCKGQGIPLTRRCMDCSLFGAAVGNG